MGTATKALSVEIGRSPAVVFDALTHLGSMVVRLGRSASYGGTIDVSDDPVRVGSTYTDRTPIGRLHGEVRELEPDRRIVFHQATSNGWLAVLIGYDLEPTDGGTRLARTGRITTRGPLALVHPLVVWATSRENRRTMDRLRVALEGNPPNGAS